MPQKWRWRLVTHHRGSVKRQKIKLKSCGTYVAAKAVRTKVLVEVLLDIGELE